MLILVEGPDGAGKTTLVDELVRKVQEIEPRPPLKLHCGPLTVHPLVAYELVIEGYDARGGRSVVADRWHWGEDIYGPLLRGRSKMTPTVRTYIEMFLASKGALMVVLNPRMETLQKRLKERGDDLIDSNDLYHIKRGYQAALQRHTPMRVMQSLQADQIIKNAQHLQIDAAPIAKFRTYIGVPKPRILLLGDTYGPGDQQAHLKAFVPYAATSGAFLMQAVDDMARHKQIGIANANDEPTLPLLHYTLGEPRVVALGRNAQRTALRQGIRCGVVPHPQYIRRFHYRRCHDYGRLIAEVALSQEDRGSWPK